MSLSVHSAALASDLMSSSEYCCVAKRRCPSIGPLSAEPGAVNGACRGPSLTAAPASSSADRASPTRSFALVESDPRSPRRPPVSSSCLGLELAPGPTAQNAGVSRIHFEP